MNFLSDNAVTTCPEVVEAVLAANHATAQAYDGDAWSARLDGAFADFFGAPCSVFAVSSGTAANALSLAAMVPPYGAVVCHREAHIEVDECGAPGFYTGGAKLMLVDGDGAKVTPQAVGDLLGTIRNDVHQMQAAALSITNATEYGLTYRPAEVAALGDVCRTRHIGFHMDGARFGNAVASLGCHPADVTVRAGVDVLSFGFAKNGGMGAEALVYFDPTHADAARYRRKRAGHLQSKGRFLAVQLLAMLERNAGPLGGRAPATAEALPLSLVAKAYGLK